jgi:hypothetical protein
MIAGSHALTRRESFWLCGNDPPGRTLTGFEPSWPHLIKCRLNEYTTETDRHTGTQVEVE